MRPVLTAPALRSWQEAAEADRRKRRSGVSAAERAAAWEAEKAEARIAKVIIGTLEIAVTPGV